MSAATVSRWTRLFVAASVAWFVVWQVGVALGAGRRFAVVVGLQGFVFHVVFGKAYSLVPSYFDRELAVSHAPAVHLPLAAGGTAALAVDAAGGPDWGGAGAAAWALGCAVLVGALAYSVRDNLTGRETGTAEAKADRRPVDRFANAFVPVALLYVLLGAALPALAAVGVDAPLPAAGPPVTHLLAAGGAALLLFAVGFRLLPRFLVVTPRRSLVAVVLPAAAAGPILLATYFLDGRPFVLGAALQAVALLGFTAAYLDMFRRSDRRRIGLYVVGVAVCYGAVVALLGLHMATAGVDARVAEAHARVALLGFLGLAIVGVNYQFYPPAVATVRRVDDRTAAAAVALLAAGLGAEVIGLLAGVDAAVLVGRWVAVLGALVHAAVLGVVFAERGF
ncbi:hypothetical protein HWV07_19150 [Natronomonas salina]|uniref:hypothetical protein n=1 Tax=Natronomonas salina TaxID=1710540 RepID=UPI0015B672D0|nr:hypothetical protein [Natronomonas salina]QLD91048.1 hypothetical protein HWV07_19150 [Natronomonas salina]